MKLKIEKFVSLWIHKSPKVAMQHVVGYLYRNFIYVFNVRESFYRLIGYSALPHPYKTLRVDPTDIEYYASPEIYKGSHRNCFGKITDGDWDIKASSIENHFKYQACKARVEKNISWEETGIIDKMYEKLLESKADSIEHGCSSREDIKTLYEVQREDLYQSLRADGYNEDISGVACRIHIGRDGRLIFGSGGRHRVFLSHILGIDEIPVKVLFRHKEWQEKRERMNQAQSISELSSDIKQYLDHPDMQDIAPSSS